MSEPKIVVTGLKEFTRALKRMDSDLPKQVRLANNQAANIVVRYTVAKVPTGPPAGGHARSSVKAKSTRTTARVTAGGSRYSYYGWLDFGGRIGPKGSVRRPYIKGGRYLYVALRDHFGEVYDAYVKALTDVARSAGIETEES